MDTFIVPQVFQLPLSPNIHVFHCKQLLQPLVKTVNHYNSFFKSAVRHWNPYLGILYGWTVLVCHSRCTCIFSSPVLSSLSFSFVFCFISFFPFLFETLNTSSVAIGSCIVTLLCNMTLQARPNQPQRFQDTKSCLRWGLSCEATREATTSTKTFGRLVLKNSYYPNAKVANILIHLLLT